MRAGRCSGGQVLCKTDGLLFFYLSQTHNTQVRTAYLKIYTAMRLTIFRGKRKDNGQWVEGYLTKKLVFCDASNDGRLFYAIVTAAYYNEYREFVEEWHEVDNNTIGQYTGYEDCNGTPIFEGDVVAFMPLPVIEANVHQGKVAYIPKLNRFAIQEEDGYCTPLDFIKEIEWAKIMGDGF